MLSDISMDFNLREGGYKLDFGIDGIKVDLLKIVHAKNGQ